MSGGNNSYEYDSLTGLKNYEVFKSSVQEIIDSDEEGIVSGSYSFAYFDIMRFKVINNIFGTQEGDNFLIFMADQIKRLGGDINIATRINSDRFVLFTKQGRDQIEKSINLFLEQVANYPLPYEIICSIGIYVTMRPMKVDLMIDRAILAHSTIKGDYETRYCFYDHSQRDAMLSEQEITSMMRASLEDDQFVVYYQPQYDHTDGSLIGAEALVRWLHPKRGVISPGVFIPIFEKNGFITKLDLFVFESVCSFIRKSLDSETPVVPISVNISRRDIYKPDLVKTMENIRRKYNVPVDLIRIEVTESALIDGVQRLNDVIDELHRYGYIIEMDDFGSAYSSLNSLKNIDLDILKLDLKFLSDEGDKKHGGIILSHVVRMAKWLGFSVIAEGVEQIEQADYLVSIGCRNIQGYLYAKPMPESDYFDLVGKATLSKTEPAMRLLADLDVNNFWSPKSLDTLMFNDYVGAAAILEYRESDDGTYTIEPLRYNKKYIKEMGDGLTEVETIRSNFNGILDKENRDIYRDMLVRAKQSGEEETCETWRRFRADAGLSCIRARARIIATSDDSDLYYVLLRNVTVEKRALSELINREKIFRMASEQLNLYYWKVEIPSKKMYPCFRCIRDFNINAVIENYPYGLYDNGIFPEDIQKQYAEVMERLYNGEREVSIDLPLTSKKLMCRIKYTTEQDEDGNNIAAYATCMPIGEN